MSATATPRKFLSPPAIARQLGVKAERVVSWCRGGQLKAYNLAEPGSCRPRFKIDPIDLEVFLNSRAVVVAPKTTRRRRRDTNIVEYF